MHTRRAGAEAFEFTGNFEHFYLCHCQHCRKDTGSAHAANLFSTTAVLTWLSGSDVSMRPDAHIFASSRADWDHGLESIPSVAGLPR